LEGFLKPRLPDDTQTDPFGQALREEPRRRKKVYIYFLSSRFLPIKVIEADLQTELCGGLTVKHNQKVDLLGKIQ
jgi:hypothetical protein